MTSEFGLVRLDNLSLRAPSRWRFRPFDNLVMARADDGLGVLQISTAYREDSYDDDACGALRCALDFADIQSEDEVDHLFDGERSNIRFGRFDIQAPQEWKRFWHVATDAGLHVATYQVCTF